jgi:hypothetical protein
MRDLDASARRRALLEFAEADDGLERGHSFCLTAPSRAWAWAATKVITAKASAKKPEPSVKAPMPQPTRVERFDTGVFPGKRRHHTIEVTATTRP